MKNKIISELLIGSNNKGKVKEIRDLLPKSIKIFTTNNFKLSSPRETGKTFLDNSLIKSRYFSKKTGKICIADDSGLEIDILQKAPGIHSARWGGKKKNFNLAIKKIYKKLDLIDKGWKKKIIKARFVCAITVYGPGIKTIKALGKIEGRISPKKKGLNGFGYDPIFIPKNKKITFAQMSSKKKYKIDHRYKAFKKIKKLL